MTDSLQRLFPDTEYPHVPAAFINAISEEGTKAEAVAFLQKQWNETCALRAKLKALRSRASAQTGQQQIKDAFYAGYWAWFGPASQKELDRGCSELDKSWLEYEAALTDSSTNENSHG